MNVPYGCGMHGDVNRGHPSDCKHQSVSTRSAMPVACNASRVQQHGHLVALKKKEKKRGLFGMRGAVESWERREKWYQNHVEVAILRSTPASNVSVYGIGGWCGDCNVMGIRTAGK